MLCLYYGPELGAYGFGNGHPFGTDRLDAFLSEFKQQGLDAHANLVVQPPVRASSQQLALFHTQAHIDRVQAFSKSGKGYMDCGNTPAMLGIFDSACMVVGSVLDAVDRIFQGSCQRAFVPIAGLHHARRDSVAGFCVFNDIGVAIEHLKLHHGVKRVAYVDIDAHHGDGVFYDYEDDPDICIVDFHQDGRTLYPGTGAVYETGKGAAAGTKLNIPLPPAATDEHLTHIWPSVESFIEKSRPEFIILQCGADSIRGDPITQLNFSAATHAMVTERLIHLAEKYCHGRILALGGGGYNRENLARTWTAVAKKLLDTNLD